MGKRRETYNPLARGGATRPYRTIVWVGAEGSSERDYFSQRIFRDAPKTIKFPDRRTSQSNPRQVLKRFKRAMKGKTLRRGDECWLVVDVDTGRDEELLDLEAWASEGESNHLAISNPKFELFLLMHYGDVSGCTTAATVDREVKRRISQYAKRIQPNQFTAEEVDAAVERAEMRRRLSSDVVPPPGCTDAHLLVKSIWKK